MKKLLTCRIIVTSFVFIQFLSALVFMQYALLFVPGTTKHFGYQGYNVRTKLGNASNEIKLSQSGFRQIESSNTESGTVPQFRSSGLKGEAAEEEAYIEEEEEDKNIVFTEEVIDIYNPNPLWRGIYHLPFATLPKIPRSYRVLLSEPYLEGSREVVGVNWGVIGGVLPLPLGRENSYVRIPPEVQPHEQLVQDMIDKFPKSSDGQGYQSNFTKEFLSTKDTHPEEWRGKLWSSNRGELRTKYRRLILGRQ